MVYINRGDKFMREEFMKRIDARKNIESYPFGAEEMLLHREFKDLGKSRDSNVQKTKTEVESYPFGQEEMLLNKELERFN